MIVEFRFRNFRSFRDMQTLSFVATSDASHPMNVTAEPQIGNKKLVRAAVIYGANASGKSNVIDALHFFREFVLNSGSRRPGEPIPVQPFLLDDHSTHERSEFELTFIHDDVRYMYAISLDRIRVHREVLIAYPQGPPQTWFEREYDHEMQQTQYKFGARLHGEKKRLQSLTRDDVLFLSIAATFNQVQLGEIYRYIRGKIQILTSHQGTDLGTLEKFTARFADNNALKLGTIAMLRLADLGVQDFSVENLEPDVKNIPDYLQDFSIAEMTNEQRNELGSWLSVNVRLHQQSGKQSGELVEFPIANESLGTRRLFALSSLWHLSLLLGATVAVDELDASLHPLLVRALLNMFSARLWPFRPRQAA